MISVRSRNPDADLDCSGTPSRQHIKGWRLLLLKRVDSRAHSSRQRVESDFLELFGGQIVSCRRWVLWRGVSWVECS